MIQEKRRWPNRACDYCRLKKIRCDATKTWPKRCSNCVDKECTFKEVSMKPFPTSYVRDIEQKLTLYEALVEKLAPGQGLNDDLENSFRNAPRKHSHDATTAIDHTMDQSDEEVFDGASLDPQDTTDADKMRYFGSVREVMYKIKAHSLVEQSMATQKRPQYWSLNIEDENHIPFTNEDFGPDEFLYRFVATYFQKVNSTFPLLNKIRFIQDIPQRKLERGFGSILILVCALGSLYCDDERMHLPNREPFGFLGGSSYFQTYKKKAPNYSLTAATLEDIQALMLLQMFVQRSSHLQSSWNLNGAALIIAEDISLYHQLNHLNVYEREARKRAYYCIYFMDRSLSAAYGRRIMLKDEDVSLEHLQPLPEEIGTEEHYSVIYFTQMIKLYKIQGQIDHQISLLKKQGNRDNVMSIVASMSSCLNDWVNEIPRDLQYDDNCQDNFVFQLMSNLRIAFFNIQLLMYRNFVPHPGSTKFSQFKVESLLICANAAKSMLKVFHVMELKRHIIQNYIDFLMNLGPFHALVILILSACESRRTGQVDVTEIDYIEIGIMILRRREIKDIVAGKTLDVILHLLESCRLPVRVSGQRTLSDDYNTGVYRGENVIDPPYEVGGDDILNNMFNLLQSNSIDFGGGVGVPEYNYSGLSAQNDVEWNNFLLSIGLQFEIDTSHTGF
ncbi:hypothetical protein E3P94_04136 [Wallemia ichthyophaga]|nr:hypothetical protein E3P98_04128 [Wallemia ichthyophaga]TIA94669.1 hypothetical protein E3P95_04135 [Wallemia ichthyophaga]TIA95123.1 hypothetical protein E3P94_04136 [Wallemia ichthyophaga]